jgi:hypothetical protein
VSDIQALTMQREPVRELILRKTQRHPTIFHQCAER